MVSLSSFLTSPTVTINLDGATLRVLVGQGRVPTGWASVPVNPRLVQGDQVVDPVALDVARPFDAIGDPKRFGFCITKSWEFRRGDFQAAGHPGP
jgi:hypothetical protein